MILGVVMGAAADGFLYAVAESSLQRPAINSCGCIGPQNGEPVCPCQMRSATIEDGRYVQKRDLGPAPKDAK